MLKAQIDAAMVYPDVETVYIDGELNFKAPQMNSDYKFLTCAENGRPIASKNGKEWCFVYSDVLIEGEKLPADYVMLTVINSALDNYKEATTAWRKIRTKLKRMMETKEKMAEKMKENNNA